MSASEAHYEMLEARAQKALEDLVLFQSECEGVVLSESNMIECAALGVSAAKRAMISRVTDKHQD